MEDLVGFEYRDLRARVSEQKYYRDRGIVWPVFNIKWIDCFINESPFQRKLVFDE